jgi:hypothetical protein
MTESTRLHDLQAPWRYWLWGGDAVEVPPGTVHEDVAEKVVGGTALPRGRTAASWLLEQGAVKQWDLHFITGSKSRDALRAVQHQLWEMVAREKLTLERRVLLSFGGDYALASLDEVLTAKSWNDLTTQRGRVRENALAPKYALLGGAGSRTAFDWEPWHSWWYRGEWLPVGEFGVHEEMAIALLDRDDPGWAEREKGVYAEAVGILIRHHGAIEQWGVSFNLARLTKEYLQIIQDRVMDMIRAGIGPQARVEVSWGQDKIALLPANELLEAKNEREVEAASRMVSRNPSYLDSVKKVMAESYGEATTDNPNESGFLLADGTWLKMGFGNRGDDHRTVTGYVRGKLLQEVYQGDRWNALVRWMQVTGSIRWMPENCSFDIFVRPTSEQLDRIWRMCRRCEETTVEQTRGKKKETRIFTPPERDEMVAWIREFWR